MTDKTTIAVYDAKVNDYAQMVPQLEESVALTQFIDAVTPGGTVLDLGCGPGKSAALLRDRGFHIDAVDASPGMIAMANETFSLNARVGTFNDVSEVNHYHGIWANFSLLHASELEFLNILNSLHTALTAHGALHLGMKVGTGSNRDALGRLYTYYSQEDLESLLENSGFSVQTIRTGSDVGLAGTNDPWITVLSEKAGL